ncbi:unnamed protein product [Cladocopium goreaui]|uniref:Guanine nucleotide-binding protein-like 1 n=1 Tax=Cladocopium goreaui TaxID=2562237 RepID=A0A9P1DHA2_9DINO|nr:unnamed protein product [Cladocopium goreaui]|mmetsp:Transcript_12106/g.26776  ORF Transcript_12106/g.26776 Transcript_12106/m.26776 type:complete len:643 (-) Transcript_12106:111-2039(-)
MTRSKGSQKTSIKLGARIDKDVKIDRQSTTLDFKSAAAMPEFNPVDPLAHVSGKKAATTSGMKTIFAAESSLNVNRRIRNAAVPLGCAVEDDAAVVEELTLQGVDLERSRKLMPRRPAWSYEISSGRLHHREAQSFKQWLTDVQDLIQARGGYPPAYETNLQVWRQLWRVLERCNVAVCVIDARHPLLHLPPALIYHVNRTLRKPLLVVLNKLDAVSEENAICWAQALQRIPGIAAVLGYSKEDLRHRNFGDLQLGKEALIEISHRVYSEWLASRPAESTAATIEAAAAPAAPAGRTAEATEAFVASEKFTGARTGYYFGTGPEGTGFYPDTGENRRSAMKSPKSATDPDVDGNGGDGNGSVVLGLIGHPNVGKSSMVNHLMGEKVVSVKATPGHTKILQTLQLNENTCLCDSPGVVFPRLEVPREAQIVGMLVPLAQVREPFSAIRWVMERSEKPLAELLGLKPVKLRRVRELFEAGLETLQLNLVEAEDDDEVVPWSPMLLCAQLATQRGFVQNGRPDCMKAGTEILERVLSGRIAYSVPPPAATASGPKPPEDGNDSDWNICDEDFESEEEEEEIGDRDLLELFGQEATGIGRSSKASIKRFKRRQKLAEIAGEADPARTLRPYAGRLQEVEAGAKPPI